MTEHWIHELEVKSIELNQHLNNLNSASGMVSKYEKELKKQDEKKKEIEKVKAQIEEMLKKSILKNTVIVHFFAVKK